MATINKIKVDGASAAYDIEDALLWAKFNDTIANNAGAHNAIYRGKNLGSSVTAAQYSAISSGQFTDMFVGDYWTIGGVNWRIAAFDYWYNTGDSACTKHHAVIVPDTQLYAAQMHNTASGGYESPDSANITTGGYMGSDMYKTNLERAKTTINTHFANHVLNHREYLINATTSAGVPSGGVWVDSTVELMSEHMVYGSSIFGSGAYNGTFPHLYTIDCIQLPLFQHRPDMKNVARNWYWLRDVVSYRCFACVGGNGYCNCYNSSSAGGVRPAFAIC